MPTSYETDNISNIDVEYCRKVMESLVNEEYPKYPRLFALPEIDESDPLVKQYEKIPPGSYSHDGFVTDFKLSSKDTLWF